VDSVGVRTWRNVWMQSFLSLLSSLSSCDAVLSSLLLSGVCNWRHSPGVFFFYQFFV
jgi:hypothetical protein